jgi:hypothetical protein
MRRSAGLVLATVALGLAVWLACVAWTRVRSPDSAEESTSAVWIALLKGFSGEVYYVGSKNGYAYFRVGNLFWSYYKVPECLTKLPRTFPLGNGQGYIVQPRTGPFPGGKGSAIWIDVLPYGAATTCPSPASERSRRVIPPV